MTALADVTFDPTTQGPMTPPPTPVIHESQQQIGSEDTSKMTVSAQHLSRHSMVPEFVSAYTLGDELGSGGFGFVVSATRNSDQKEVAVKFIFRDKVPLHGWAKDPELGVIPMEIYVLRNVAHANIIGFMNVYQDYKYFYLVMELHGTPWSASNPLLNNMQGSMIGAMAQATLNQMNPAAAAGSASTTSSGSFQATSTSSSSSSLNQLSDDEAHQPPKSALLVRRTSCDLFECIEHHSKFTEIQARVIFKQIVECVHYLNSRGICHRDIKDENIVIDNDFRVKLIDFGSAVIIPKPQGKLFDRFYGTINCKFAVWCAHLVLRHFFLCSLPPFPLPPRPFSFLLSACCVLANPTPLTSAIMHFFSCTTISWERGKGKAMTLNFYSSPLCHGSTN